MRKQYPACARVPISTITVHMRRWKRPDIIVQATPLTASSCSKYVCNDDVFALLECRYWTIDRYDKEQTSPLASLEAQWLALVPNQQTS